MVIYVVSMVRNVLQLFRIESSSSNFKHIYISAYLSMLSPIMVEPVLEGATRVFIIFCIINDMTEKILYSCKRKGYYR